MTEKGNIEERRKNRMNERKIKNKMRVRKKMKNKWKKEREILKRRS